MRIRSITCFYDPGGAQAGQELLKSASFIEKAAARLSVECCEVQSTRLATTPFPTWLQVDGENEAIEKAAQAEADAKSAGFAYLGLGPALPSHPRSFDLLLPMLTATQNTFFGGVMADLEGGIYLPALRACARIVEQAAPATPDGFTNLRFAALANVAPYTPFFPAAFASSGPPAFALAIEAADVAQNAFRRAGSLEEARHLLLKNLEERLVPVERISQELAASSGLEFKGIDCSLAPFPEDWCSIGAALESLGVPGLGLHGSLAAAAFLADSLDRGAWKKTGFNGLFLPVLEDSTLAMRAGQTLALKDLLLFSAVCGAGLDTVPLPGDVTAGQIEALLLDVAALALRLNKPLTARLMPVPRKAAGDEVEFDFSYFSKGRAIALEAQPVSGLLHGDEIVDIRPRKPRET